MKNSLNECDGGGIGLKQMNPVPTTTYSPKNVKKYMCTMLWDAFVACLLKV